MELREGPIRRKLRPERGYCVLQQCLPPPSVIARCKTDFQPLLLSVSFCRSSVVVIDALTLIYTLIADRADPLCMIAYHLL